MLHERKIKTQNRTPLYGYIPFQAECRELQGEKRSTGCSAALIGHPSRRCSASRRPVTRSCRRCRQANANQRCRCRSISRSEKPVGRKAFLQSTMYLEASSVLDFSHGCFRSSRPCVCYTESHMRNSNPFAAVTMSISYRIRVFVRSCRIDAVHFFGDDVFLPRYMFLQTGL